ncbi:Shedu immune nuclease family protein [Sporolactobacillus sp. Y61]|uniref:Shedu immune nuclease family protein n=1 Tax=Sporolactobacillus sp. Y61 TaxID=3160863 RepID=A0AAU8II64_9BACL
MSSSKYSIQIVNQYLVLSRMYDMFRFPTDYKSTPTILYYFHLLEKDNIDNVFSLQNSFKEINYEQQADLLSDLNDEETLSFVIGKLNGSYYRLVGLNINPEIRIYFANDLQIKPYFLVVQSSRIRPSLWSRITSVTNQKKFYIGGDEETAWNENDFVQMARSFPNRTEIDKYIDSETSKRVQNYVDLKENYPKKLDNYISRKIIYQPMPAAPEIKELDLQTRKSIEKWIQKMDGWLKEDVDEKSWQRFLLQIFPFLFPQYIYFKREIRIPIDSNSKKLIDIPDFFALKNTGSIDLIEIKKPSFQVLRRGQYRGNYVFSNELEGQITQTQKYLYNLTRWGKAGENQLSKKFQQEMRDSNVRVFTRNPKALLVIGRSNKLDEEQIRDFDILRQKQEDIADIITYDDLLKRMKMILLRNFNGYWE